MKRLQVKNCILFCLLLLLCACEKPAVPAVQTQTAVPTAAIESEEVSVLPAAETSAPLPTPVHEDVPAESPTPAQNLRFTMVWASDTQTMIARASMREGFQTVCGWIAQEAEAKNFAIFLHTGDMVGDGDVKGQWELFNAGVATIREKLPIFYAAGNHDEGYSNKSPWKKQPFSDAVPKEQQLNSGDASYMILTVGETKLLLLSISWRKIEDGKTQIALLKAARRMGM